VTLAATVRAAAARFGPRPALVDPDGSVLTYADLDVRSDEVATGLAAEGVRPGDVVLLTLASDSAYVVAYAAVAKLGAITAGVNPRLAPPEQAAVAAVAGAVRTIASADEVAALRRPGPAPAPLEPDPERPVALVFTSGTTGTPKGALFLERQLAAVTTADVADAWGDPAAPATPMLAGTQFAHVGMTTKLPWYLRMGMTTHVLGRWRAADALACIAEHRIPSIGGVAPQMALLLREDLEAYDLSCVQTIIMGGAASPPALVREARERLGAAYSIRYSSTESGGCGTGTAFDADDEEALFTVGRPRGIEVQVRDDEGLTVGVGEVGEVWLRSPTTMAGYWRDEGATAATLVGGWLRTGDLGALDERGNLRLAGRSKEMFIRGGYNVYPAEVEAVLVDHPAVRELAVVPRPDDVMGEVGVAVVVPADPGRPPTLEDLRAFASERLARFKLPEALRIVDALPLTPMLKVDRRALAEPPAHHQSPERTSQEIGAARSTDAEGPKRRTIT
jgi:acyl-CoA synthetase (AMP-forming)/AMP-acid ligase II